MANVDRLPELKQFTPGYWAAEVPLERRRPSREFINWAKQQLLPTAAEMLEKVFPEEAGTNRNTTS